MTTFSVNGIYAGINIGTFVAVGNTSSFTSSVRSDGWIVCDGVLRTNTNGIYTNLANLGIGTLSNSDANYTPPDLNSCTMIGKTSTTTLRTFVGNSNNSVTLQSSNMPSHTHSSSITAHDNTHTHSYTDTKIDDSVSSGKRPANQGSLVDTDITRTTSANSHGHGATSSNNTGNSTPINILNSSYIVNWIAKL
jgi:microcystin-dependent protein